MLSLIDVADCPANIRLVPHVNPLGWNTFIETGNGRFSNPNFVNWNRMFAESPPIPLDRPTVEQVLASALLRLAENREYILDVHTPEFGWPHLYASGLDTRLNTFDDLPHILGDAGTAAFADHHALRRQPGSATRRAVTLELPSHRAQTVRDLEYWAQRLRQEIWSLAESSSPPVGAPPMTGTMMDINASFDGICYPAAEPGVPCERGAPIATIIAPSGRQEDLVAEIDVVPLCFRRSTVARAGSWAVRCLAVLDASPSSNTLIRTTSR